MRKVLWPGVIVLVTIGVAAGAARAIFLTDLGQRIEPSRRRFFASIGIVDPLKAERAAFIDRFERNYRENPLMTRLHVIPGALFLLFGALQFSERTRRRHLRLHRWSGRVLVILALAGVGFSAFYFSVLTPFAGFGETLVIAPFATLFVVSIVRGYFAIRRRDIATHRAWMIRAYAVAAGISVVRLVSMVLDPLLAPHAVQPSTIFLLSVWIGFVASVAFAEVWLRGSVGEVRHRRLA